MRAVVAPDVLLSAYSAERGFHHRAWYSGYGLDDLLLCPEIFLALESRLRRTPQQDLLASPEEILADVVDRCELVRIRDTACLEDWTPETGIDDLLQRLASETQAEAIVSDELAATTPPHARVLTFAAFDRAAISSQSRERTPEDLEDYA